MDLVALGLLARLLKTRRYRDASATGRPDPA
jgi:hypothetical protein